LAYKQAMTEPEDGTAERWAWDYVVSTSLERKLAPPAVPDRWESEPPPRRLSSPGRPPELTVASACGKTPRAGALRSPERRAQLVHTFLHHELQAAELMCWAVLAFADTPRAFRRGLLAICADEVRHMGMYRAYLVALGFDFGSFPVRDWFWERVPLCADAASFTATLGVGLEGGNIDHARRFAERFREAGDERGAALQLKVGEEEIAHVRFALKWFTRFTGHADFDSWRRHLPPPLSPILMRGRPINRPDRLRCGLSEAFVDRLESYEPN
jgi:uncharacterized ferritin-like protein (DUF455 family)